MSWIRVILSVFAVSFATAALAQQPLYGPPISADEAKKVAAAGLAEARKNNFNMAVAVVDSTGHLVYFERMDTVQLGSIAIAQDKAMATVNTRRSTKSVYDEMEKGGAGLRYLNLRGFVTSEGLFWAKLAAAGTMAMLPVVLVGWIAQRQLVRGLSLGAVK